MGISVINILRHSIKFNIIRIIAGVISVPKNIIIAVFLLPKDYGLIGFLSLWSMYAGLINPGILSAGCREIPYLLGKNDEKGMLRIQNISISADLLYRIFPFTVIFCASFFFSNPVIKIGLMITAVSFVLSNFVAYWCQVNFVKQKFSLVAKGKLINSVSVIVTILILIYWLRVYAVLLAPIISSIVVGTYYWKKGRIGYRFQFDWQEIKRLFKVGIVLSLGTLAFWGYKMADRTIIAASLPLKDLGLYVYAMGFIMVGWNFFADFGRVLRPILWKHSGEAKSIVEGFSDTKRIAVYLALATALAIPFSQVCFYLLVNLITSKYIDSIPIFYILSCNLYLASMVIIPSYILNSKVVNKQAIFTIGYSIGLGLNIVLDLLAIHLGYGICGVAWVTVGTQGMVTFVLYFLARNYVFIKIKEFISFISFIAFPFLISILFSVFHNFLSSIVLNPWAFGGISLTMQAIVWSVVIWLFYRKYFPKEKVVSVVKEFTNLAVEKLKKKRET